MTHPSEHTQDTGHVTYGLYQQHDGLDEFEIVVDKDSHYETTFEVPTALSHDYELARKLFNSLHAKVWGISLRSWQ